jgi:hypothetical protein
VTASRRPRPISTTPPAPAIASSRPRDRAIQVLAVAGGDRPRAVGEHADREEEAAQDEQLQRDVPAGRVGELGQHDGEDDDGLRVREPDDEPLAHDPPRPLRHLGRVMQPGEGVPFPEHAQAEQQQVGRAGQLHDGEDGVGALDERAQPEGHQDGLHHHAAGVPDYGGERRPPPERHPPADDEEHARAGDDDEHERRDRKLEQVITWRHRRRLYRPPGIGGA